MQIDQVHQNWIRQYRFATGDEGLETTVLSLSFAVEPAHLTDQGKMTLLCTSTVGSAAGLNSASASTASLAASNSDDADGASHQASNAMEVQLIGTFCFFF